MSLKKTIACLRKNKAFLITSHTNLEGDALGSELAFYSLLRSMGKQAVIVNNDNPPYNYDCLPGIKEVRKFKKNLKDLHFDCFVTVDCADLRRCGEVAQLNSANKPILNIDHHISNVRFGQINWVDPQASCCAEMVYSLYKKLRIPFNKDTATLLYIGILTDTGSFRYINTTGLTHAIASELMKYNLDVSSIYRKIYGSIPLQDMRLLVKILPTMQREASGKIVWFELKRNIFKDKRILFDLNEQILNFARNIKGVEVAVIFRENLRSKDEVKVNLRSQGKVDVNKIAAIFGGGGHRTASGCTIKGAIDQVRRRVLARLRNILV